MTSNEAILCFSNAICTKGLKDEGGNKLRVWDWHTHTTIFKIDNQQGAAIQHGGLCSILCNNLYGKRVWERIDICTCITESLYCTPEITQPCKSIIL